MARRLLSATLRALTGLSLFVTFAVVLISSLSRYLLNAPFVWSEEMAKYAMIYGVMFGGALAFLDGTQIRLGLLADAAPARARPYLAAAMSVICLVFGAVLAWSGWLFADKRGGILSSGLDVPMFYPQLAMAVGGIAFMAVGIVKLAESASKDQPQP